MGKSILRDEYSRPGIGLAGDRAQLLVKHHTSVVSGALSTALEKLGKPSVSKNWYGQGESDCLIKTKQSDGRKPMLATRISAQASAVLIRNGQKCLPLCQGVTRRMHARIDAIKSIDSMAEVMTPGMVTTRIRQSAAKPLRRKLWGRISGSFGEREIPLLLTLFYLFHEVEADSGPASSPKYLYDPGGRHCQLLTTKPQWRHCGGPWENFGAHAKACLFGGTFLHPAAMKVYVSMADSYDTRNKCLGERGITVRPS
ncbi:unnamed protein product [Bathycoccus prasinos]